MSRAADLGAYIDIERQLNAALAHGGGTFDFPTPGAAMNWRHRAFRFLKLYRQKNDGRSPWDIFTIRLAIDKATKKAAGSRVHVVPGQPIEPEFTPAVVIDQDDLVITEAEKAEMRAMDRDRRKKAEPITAEDLGFGDET